ncbi:non-ribosomal peptide synthase protein (TIGR01720 family)/amino acid adenylation domain-containing protein, partial [Chitinophaga sp. S165]
KDVLMYPQLKQLSERIRRSEREVSQGLVEGPVQLGAIQHAFFEHGYKHPGHYNQAVLLESLQPLEESTLRALLSRIIAHHDALRMVYRMDADGNWQQHNLGLEQEYGLHVYDLRGVADWDKQMLVACNQIQSGIDLQTGPLLQVGLFIFEDVSRILLAAHHLVIDGVSWRILFEDLSILMGQHQRGEALQLPRKSDSFQYWQEQVRHYSNSEELKQEHAYWSSLEQRSIDAIPVDHPGGSNLYRDERSEHYVLSETLTQQLQGGCHQVYGTDINDLLLCALGLSFKDVFGVRNLLIRQEGHGREQLGTSEVDVTRTVGWFTSVYPVLLNMGEGSEQDVLASLVRVKEQLHRVPNKGVGYGILRYISPAEVRDEQSYRHEPEVTFNYLGDFGVGVEDKEGERYFTYSGRNSGNAVNEEEEREELLSVQGIVAGGRLRITVSYSGLQYDTSTIRRLLESYSRHLEAVIDRLSKEEGRYKTPVDLTYKGLTIAELSELERSGVIEDVYELTPLQQGMYYHWLSSPSSTAYFEQIIYRIEGELDRASLEYGYKQIVARHAILRTSFTDLYGNVALQIVRKEATPAFTFLDLRTDSNFDLKAFAAQDRSKGFNLEEGSQMRLAVLQTGEREYTFLWSHHHILMDGWCTGIIIREFYQLYYGHRQGRMPVLPTVAPYSQYIRWLQNTDHRNSLDYWKHLLNDYNTAARFPANPVSRTTAKEKWYKEKDIVIDAALLKQLRSLCAELAITENTFIQAAWGVLLSKYNNTKDVVYGAVVSGRPGELAGVEDMVGLFINTIPVRIKYDDDTSVSGLLRQVQLDSINGLSHHHVQLAEIQSQSDLGRNLIDHILVFENYPVQDMVRKEMEERFELKIKNTDFFGSNSYDLTVLIVSDAIMKIQLKYDTGLYSDPFMEHLAANLCETLSWMLNHSNELISDARYLNDSEHNELLSFEHAAYKGEALNVVSRFENIVKQVPGNRAVIAGNGTLTYDELNNLANQLSAYLIQQQGVKNGDVIGIKLDRADKWLIVAMLAILKSAAAFLPLDGDEDNARFNAIVEDAGCKVIINPALITAFENDLEVYPVENRELPVTGADICYVIYTSGTTGKPKGVMIHHRAVLNYLEGIVGVSGIGMNDSSVITSSYAFDLIYTSLFSTIFNGGAIHLIPEDVVKTPVQLANYIIKEGVTFLKMTPTLFNILANYSDIAELLGTSSIRLIFLGGEPPLPSNIKLVRRYPHIRLFNHYGPTETTIGACVHEITDDNLAGFLARPVVGKPLANNYVYILDKNYQMLPTGAVGEICIGGEGVSSGYLHRLELTAAKFREDAWKPGQRIYCTGDLGRRLEDGTIMFLGRMDDQVKIRGYRVELGEVEEAMRSIKEVEEAKVIVRKYDFGEQELVAYWIGDETLSGMSLRNELSRSLPSYMIPAYFVHLESFPVTGNGKLDYSALPQPSDEDWYGQEYIAPVEDREQVLINICEEVLRRRPIGMLDDFFALGGDSIKSIQVVSRLRQHGYYLSVKDVLMYPQLKQLSERIRRSEREVSQGVVEGPVQLGAIQHAFFEHGYKHPGHYNQAVLLESLQPLDESTLRALLSRIIAHHDALRMVYRMDADGNWQQHNLGLEQEYGLHVYDLRGVADWDKQMLAACNQIQSGIDLQTGPLLQVGLFIFEDVSRILLAAHHLVIDGVSWRILFEDLSILMGQHQRGEALQLPRKSDSFQYWQEQVRHYSNSEELKQEHAYWSLLEQRSIDAIPVDHPGSSNLYRDERSEHYVLSETLTQQLQGSCHQVYNTDINDLLLCALGLSFKDVFGVRDLLIRQEGHGREQLGASEVDVTRTVGWFTSVYPVLLEMGEGHEQDVLTSLVRVKEQLHRVPNKGVGYGILRYISPADVRGEQSYHHEPEVTFNYLGDFGVGIEDKEGERYFTYAAQGGGNTINDQEERSELLSVQGIVTGGRLRITVSYSGLQYDRSTIQRLLESYGGHLEAVIDRLSKEEGRYKTPVDLTYKGLTIAELSELERSGAIEDVYELTPLQQGMYYHWLSSPSSSAYFEQIAYQIKGELDVKALEDAYYFIIARHAILRTGFTYDYGVPLQVVRKNVHTGFVYRDVSAEKGFSVAAFVSADRMAGFDLNGHSQMRLTVIKTGAGEYNFSWCNHHIVMDGWCSGIIINEFYQVYNYFSSGKTPVLDKVYPYASYVRWLSRVNPDVSLNYWNNYLSGYSSVASVPAAKTGKSVTGREMKNKSTILSPSDVSRIRTLCSEMGITENSFFQTAWGILLGRYNNTRDVVFGGVVSGRPAELEGVERIVGLFINTVPLRLKYEADTPVSVLLKDMQAANIEGMGHHYIQLAQIQSRHELGAALFDHVFIFENYPVEEMVEAAGKEQGTSINILSTEVFAENNYPFSIVILPGQQVEVRFMYDAGKYTDTSIERLCGHFLELVGNMIADPLQKVSGLSYIPLAERRQLWNDSNGPEITYPVNKTLPQLFTEQAVRRADHPAVVFRDHTLTYAELDRLSDHLACYLSSYCGLRPGDVAGMKLKRSEWAVVSILGIMKAGCVYVPIDVAYPADRIAYMEDDSACRVILDETFISQFRNWSAANPDARKNEVPSTAADLAYILYTSGSTGMPKGVMLEHGTVINTLYNIRDIVGVTEEDKGLEFSSLSFDSSIAEIFMVLLSGATLHVIDEEVKSDPLKLRDYIRRHQVSLASLPPVYLKVMDIAEEDGLRKLISMGEAAVKSVAQRFSQFGRFFNGYGPTEGSIAVSMHYMPAEAITEDLDIIPIGKAFGNAEMLLLDDALELVPVGVIGEICIGGTGVSRGYLNKPGLTAEKFISHPYRSGKRLYRTGDLGRRKEDGNIEFIGRKDDQVKLRGQRIELGEIEKVLCAYENITDALVVLKEQPEGDKYLAAYVVNPPTEKRVSVQALRDYLSGKLPVYMVPAAFSVLDSFPLTPNGKIDRKGLPEPQEGDTAGQTAYVPPRTEQERLLVETCEDILRHSGIGMLDDFFALGGDSIKSIQLVSRMRQQGYHLQVGDVLDYPLLEEMSRKIKKGVRAIPQGPVTGDVLPGPIQLAYLLSDQPDKHYYNQAVLLRSSERLDVEILQAIFAIIVSHHDALRMVFRYNENKWGQHNLGLDQRYGMTVRDLRQQADWRAQMEQHCVAVQSGISLSDGPLFHACVFQCPDEDRLLLVAHHLVVDGVSWRILLEDLGTLYEQGIAGQPMKLPQKTDSLQYWMEQQHRYASSPALLAEVPYWKAITGQALPSFPVDDATGSNSFSDENTVSFVLGKEDTTMLQTRCYQAYNTEINDILLTVLGLAVKQSLGTDRFLVQLEGHGREHIGADIDVTRTVGWFTSVYPVLMDYSAQHTAVRHLIETKERLHRIPNKGIGFGILRHLSPASLHGGLTYSVAPAITFNYLGDFNSGTGSRTDKADPRFKLSGEAHGSAVSDQQHRDTLLAVSGIIVNGELRISVSYSSKQYLKPTVDKLLNTYRQVLQDLIPVLTQAQKQLTPVDLTYTGLRIDELSALTSRSEIEDVYQLTPFQHDLFQLWKNKTAPEVYFLQLNYDIRGNLDKELLQQSYHYVVAGNANLRTTFTDDFGVPLQVVHRSIPGGFHYEDVRDNDDFVLEDFLKKDRNAGIDIKNSSPVRLNIFRTGEDAYHFVWSKHHIIIDGWCGSILVKEFYNAYARLTKGQQLLPGKQHLYSGYLKWLSERDEAAEISYWTDYINGYRNPVKGRWKITDAPGAYEEQEAHLLTSTDLAQKVKERCAELGITENVMLQTIWGLLLTKLRGTDDIVFGAIVSGRPDSLEGIETMLGAFINTIPVRISYDQSPLSAFMKKVHRNNIAATRYHHVDLDKLEKQCGYNQPLVDNLFVFENYPVQDLVEEKIRKEGEDLHMEVRSTELFEVNRYPLSLIIFSSRTIFIKFKYKTTVKPELVSLFITYFEKMIAAVADDPFQQAKDYTCLQEFEMALNEITQTTGI